MTKWAVCAAVTQDMLNDLVLYAVGEGVALDPVETDVAMPAMGDVRLKVALTITGGTFDLRADDGDRVRVVVAASGVVEASAVGFDGESAPASPMMPSGPVPIPVRVEALVDPVVELRDDLTISVGLAVEGGELLGVTVDADAPAPDGVDPVTWVPMTQMVNLLFASMGNQLWDALGAHVGVVGTEVGADVGGVLSALGVAVGRADVSVGSGLLTLGIFSAGLLVFAIEGIICIAMAAPIGFLLTWLGSLIGHAIVNKAPGGSPTTLLILIAAIPALAFIENGEEPALSSVTTAIEINAGPETVWENVVEFPPLNERTYPCPNPKIESLSPRPHMPRTFLSSLMPLVASP